MAEDARTVAEVGRPATRAAPAARGTSVVGPHVGRVRGPVAALATSAVADGTTGRAGTASPAGERVAAVLVRQVRARTVAGGTTATPGTGAGVPPAPATTVAGTRRAAARDAIAIVSTSVPSRATPRARTSRRTSSSRSSTVPLAGACGP